MIKRVLPAAAAAVLVLGFATGCGGDGGRPSVDEVSQGIQDNEMFGDSMDAEIADCIAEEFHGSDLSDDALQAIADGDEDYEASDDDQDALSSISTSAVAECAGAEVPETEE